MGRGQEDGREAIAVRTGSPEPIPADLARWLTRLLEWLKERNAATEGAVAEAVESHLRARGCDLADARMPQDGLPVLAQALIDASRSLTRDAQTLLEDAEALVFRIEPQFDGQIQHARREHALGDRLRPAVEGRIDAALRLLLAAETVVAYDRSEIMDGELD